VARCQCLVLLHLLGSDVREMLANFGLVRASSEKLIIIILEFGSIGCTTDSPLDQNKITSLCISLSA